MLGFQPVRKNGIMKKWMIWTIICLLIAIIFLLLIDILIGTWYRNRLELSFSSSEFNNILTPLSSFFAVVIYSVALFTTIRQNKLINSFKIYEYPLGYLRFVFISNTGYK